MPRGFRWDRRPQGMDVQRLFNFLFSIDGGGLDGTRMQYALQRELKKKLMDAYGAYGAYGNKMRKMNA